MIVCYNEYITHNIKNMKKKNPVTQLGKKINKENIDRVIHEMGKVGGEMKNLVHYAKEKFDKADDKTKKKILTGLAGATAVLAAIIGMKKLRKKK